MRYCVDIRDRPLPMISGGLKFWAESVNPSLWKEDKTLNLQSMQLSMLGILNVSLPLSVYHQDLY